MCNFLKTVWMEGVEEEGGEGYTEGHVEEEEEGGWEVEGGDIVREERPQSVVL